MIRGGNLTGRKVIGRFRQQFPDAIPALFAEVPGLCAAGFDPF